MNAIWVDFYVDGGIIYAGRNPRRPDDRLGAAFIYSRFSVSIRAFDRDVAAFTATPGVVRDFEANVEFNYQYQVIPGWTIQPNVQLFFHPSGDASRDAVVVCARSFWHY